MLHYSLMVSLGLFSIINNIINNDHIFKFLIKILSSYPPQAK